MARANICIDLAPGRWKADVSLDHSEHSFQLLGAVPREEHAVEIVTLSGCNMGACLSDLELHSDIERFETIDRNRGSARVRLETTKPEIQAVIAQAGTPFVYPAEIRRGTLTATFLGTHRDISSLGNQLETAGMTYEVSHVQSQYTEPQVLTDRQEEIFLTAVEHGYYDNPRQCTLTEVAEMAGIAKSTCSSILHRVEQSIIEYFCAQRHSLGQSVADDQGAAASERSSN